MSGTKRVLRVVCHFVVMLWIVVALAWPATWAEPLDAGEPTQIARLQPRLQPASADPVAPPDPDPDPDTAAEPEATDPPTPLTEVGNAELRRGEDLLGGGAFPALSCSYEDFRSFRDYARAMAALGARFVVVRNREIVGGVDLGSWRVGAPALDATFSPRARDYTGEPALAGLAREARERFGSGSVVMMLVPREIDAGLFGGIAGALAARGERHESFREIRGRYERSPGGGVQLRVDSGIRLDGTRAELELLFDLSSIAALNDKRTGGGRKGRA